MRQIRAYLLKFSIVHVKRKKSGLSFTNLKDFIYKVNKMEWIKSTKTNIGFTAVRAQNYKSKTKKQQQQQQKKHKQTRDGKLYKSAL